MNLKEIWRGWMVALAGRSTPQAQPLPVNDGGTVPVFVPVIVVLVVVAVRVLVLVLVRRVAMEVAMPLQDMKSDGCRSRFATEFRIVA